ncbi:MAG: BrnT family toxin [Solirubrobacteraceae bacterium]
MPEAISELLATEAAIDKLGARSITTHDARELPRNEHAIVRNPHATSPGKRRLLIGRTDGGRTLTLVIEQTVDPTTWLIITGWDSSPRERKLLGR